MCTHVLPLHVVRCPPALLPAIPQAKKGKKNAPPAMPHARSITHKVSDKLKVSTGLVGRANEMCASVSGQCASPSHACTLEA